MKSKINCLIKAKRSLPTFAVALISTFSVSMPLYSAPATIRVSLSSTGVEGNQNSFLPSLSGDGNSVAFVSFANNLVKGDKNFNSDVFYRNLITGVVKRATVNSDGKEGNSTYIFEPPSLSYDGRYVAFSSSSTNLVVGDKNKTYDIFVHDTSNGRTERVSVSSKGIEGNGFSLSPKISGDGRYLAFKSFASNLVDESFIAGSNIYVRDRKTGTTKLASLNSQGQPANSGSQNPGISANGRYVVFESDASNLVANDTNNASDIFVRDLHLGTTRRVSVDNKGNEIKRRHVKPSISANGRFVSYASFPFNSVIQKQDIFIHDLQTGLTKLVSVNNDHKKGNDSSYDPTISGNGRYVSFASNASDLISGDFNEASDIFVRDLQAKVTDRVSVKSDGEEGDQASFGPSGISANGRVIAFSSFADNLVEGDNNGAGDIFIRRRW